MLGKGVCALSFALGPDNFCSNRTARVFSAVKTPCLFAGRNFQGILKSLSVTEIRTIFQWHWVPTGQLLGEVSWIASGCFFPPSLQWGGKIRSQTNGGIRCFQFSEGLNAEVQTFLVPETCYKACNLTARRPPGWWILHAVLRVYLDLVRLLPDAWVSADQQWVRTLTSEH